VRQNIASSYGKEPATKTRQRNIEAVGNRATGRNHYLGIRLQAFLGWINNYGHLPYEKQQELLWELGQ
jgi:hypothetical protein